MKVIDVHSIFIFVIATLIATVTLVTNVSCVVKTSETAQEKINSENGIAALGAGYYPHSMTFRLSNLHGESFKRDAKTCESCHNKMVPDISPSELCGKCHETYPHSKDFMETFLHGQTFLKDPNRCTNCHKDKDKDKDKNKNRACTDCHNFPHDSKWILTEGHAVASTSILGNNDNSNSKKITCDTCHQENSAFSTRNPQKFIACDTCHIFVPHSGEFKTTGTHGEQFLKDRTKCSKCHRADASRGGEANLFCEKCHNYPHIPKWYVKENHGSTSKDVENNPDKKVKCQNCHDQNSSFASKYPERFISCLSCHEQMPHTKDFLSTSQHGEKYLQDYRQCTKCHKTDGQNGMSNDLCKKCHSYPHPNYWSIAKNHGQTYLTQETNAANAPIVKCSNCHGEKSTFKSKYSSKFVSCGSCHMMIPHTVDFKEGDDEHVLFAKKYDGGCTKCHTNFESLMPNSEGKGCRYCHEDSDLSISWTER